MSADLERDLLEAGDGLRDVVAALRRAPQAHVPAGFSARVLAFLPHEGSLLPHERVFSSNEGGLPPNEGALSPHKDGNLRVRWWASPRVLLAVAASLVFAFMFVSLVFRAPAPSQSPTTNQASSRQASSHQTSSQQNFPQRPDGSSSACQRPDGSFSACQRPDGLFSACRPDGSFSASSAAPYVQAFAVTGLATDPSSDRAALGRAVDALVRTQKADGGWGNATLSARNVTALAQAEAVGVPRAREARRRGLRYLRLHGIGEISTADLAREAKDALTRLKGSNDAGLVCGVALASRGNMK